MSKPLLGLVNGGHHGNNNNSASDGESGGKGSDGSAEKGAVRHILVHISGNRATWEHMGIHGALWRINPEKASCIFNYDSQRSTSSGGPASATGTAVCDAAGNLLVSGGCDERICRALIRKITVIESNTNVDEVVGVSIDGLPPKEFTGNGDAASMYLLGSGRITEPQEIFSLTGNTELGMAWMKQYPKYTHDNLLDEGVMFLAGASYYFVHEGHPAIHMMRVNQDQLGVLLQEETQIQAGWFKVDMEAFLFCIKIIRENILQNAPSTFDLSSLTVRISKPDGQRWLHLPPQVIDGITTTVTQQQQRLVNTDGDMIEVSSTEVQEAKIFHIQKYLDKPLFVTLRLAIEYALPELPSAAASAATASAGHGGGASSGSMMMQQQSNAPSAACASSTGSAAAHGYHHHAHHIASKK